MLVAGRHGGCPNLGRYVRAIPSVSFNAPAYHHADRAAVPARSSPSLPHEVYAALSPAGQRVCAGLQAPPGPGPERPRFGGGLETLGWVHTEEGFKREFFAAQLAKL